MILQRGDDADSSSIARISLMPHVDYLMSPDSAFRPFVGLLGGFTFFSGDNDSATLASIGVSLGWHSFIESLSMGPRLALTYTPGIGGDADGTSIFAAQLLFHLSGWM